MTHQNRPTRAPRATPMRRSALVALQAAGAIMRCAFCVTYRHTSGTRCNASCSVLRARAQPYEMSIRATRLLGQADGGDENSLEVHDERATDVINGRPDGFEQEVSDRWVERGVVAA
jgi:hypothetical protein